MSFWVECRSTSCKANSKVLQINSVCSEQNMVEKQPATILWTFKNILLAAEPKTSRPRASRHHVFAKRNRRKTQERSVVILDRMASWGYFYIPIEIPCGSISNWHNSFASWEPSIRLCRGHKTTLKELELSHRTMLILYHLRIFRGTWRKMRLER